MTQRISTSMCSNDMKSCYNRILHPITSLCLQWMGVQELVVSCAFTSLQLLRHHVRTAYGDSPNFFGGEECLAVVYQGQILQGEKTSSNLPDTDANKGTGWAQPTGYQSAPPSFKLFAQKDAEHVSKGPSVIPN